jgi:hypothetical protein
VAFLAAVPAVGALLNEPPERNLFQSNALSFT